MEQPSGDPQEECAEEQEDAEEQDTLTRSAKGRGQVLLIGGYWKQAECCETLQDLGGPSSSEATISPSSSSECTRRLLKRPVDSVAKGCDGPAAKRKRSMEKVQCKKPKPQPANPCKHQVPGAPPAIPGSTERGAQLLLVLCGAHALRTQLPRLQLLLTKVRARHRRPPAALLGIVMQPRPEEEAEARHRLESLLCSIFAGHIPPAEVHTAVFRPGRAWGTLDVQRAASQARRVPKVDRETQTDGEGPEGQAGTCGREGPVGCRPESCP